MAKTRLAVNRRREIVHYMLDEWEKKQPAADTKLREQFIEAVNGELRAKYPEKDMEVLRKYNLTTKTVWQRFTNDGRITAFYEFIEETEMVDIPKGIGVIPASKKLFSLFDNLAKAKDKLIEKREKQRQKYRDFVNSFNYLEDIEQVIPLPESIKPPVRSLVCINPEIIAEIKKDFGK